jgi:hypothetical protein
MTRLLLPDTQALLDRATHIIELRSQIEALVNRKLEAVKQPEPDWTAIADIEKQIALLNAEVSVKAGTLAEAVLRHLAVVRE